MNRLPKRRALPLLLFFALLIVSFAILIPTAVSASGTPASSGEIEDFSYQSMTGTKVSDANTDLRFLFSIGKLDYDEVGFVFSTSADPVKTDTPKVNYKATTKVYRSVTANGDDIPAPTGRFWVAVQLSDIPHLSFATNVFVRPYVKDGSGTRYGEAKHINVCEAIGHVHEIKNPTGTATLLNPGTRCGDCTACGLTGITELDVRAAVAPAPNEKNCKSGRSDVFDECPNISSMLNNNGSQKLYPAAENNYEGRDLYYEIDLLYNSTMSNSKPDEMYLCLYNNNNGKYNPLFYFTAKDNSSCWNTYAGGFDWGTGNSVIEGPAAAETRGKLFDRYANLNDSPDTKDWGWHRIGVRIHQEARLSGDDVVYSGVSYLYIDGVQRWKIDLDMTAMSSKGTLLFTASKSGDDLSYEDVQSKLVFGFWADDIKNSTNSTYMVYGTPTLSAIKPNDFETGVVPVSDPVASNYVLGNNTVVSAKVWFMAEHEHVWDGEPVVTREATVLESGKRADHCKLCGAENPSGEAVAFVPTIWESDPDNEKKTVQESKSLTDIRGSEHFHPSGRRDTRDLYFEYSILWNETLERWDNETANSEMKIITFRNGDKHKELYYVYTNDNKSVYCPWEGCFDISCNSPDSTASIVYGPITGYAPENERTPDKYPDIGEFGWHHIGILVHQEATGSDATVNWSGWSKLYIDGEMVWHVKSNVDTLASNNLTLFKASSEESNISYDDQSSATIVGYRLNEYQNLGASKAYAVFGNARWRIVDTDFDPTSEFEPVASPVAANYELPDGTVVPAAVYFKAK